MKTHRIWIGIAAVGVASAVTGCSHTSRSVYSGPTGTATAVPVSEQRGRIVSVRDVEIRDAPPRSTSTGGALSTAVGILTGSVGAIAGAVGDVVDATKTGKQGEELTILLEDGRTVVIVQERNDPPFAPDERVLIQKGVVTTGGGSARVVRDQYFAEARPTAGGRTGFGALANRTNQ